MCFSPNTHMLSPPKRLMKGHQTWVFFCLSERVWYFSFPHGSSAKYPSSTRSTFYFVWLSNPFRRKSILHLIFSLSPDPLFLTHLMLLFTLLSLHTLEALNTQFPTLWQEGWSAIWPPAGDMTYSILLGNKHIRRRADKIVFMYSPPISHCLLNHRLDFCLPGDAIFVSSLLWSTLSDSSSEYT